MNREELRERYIYNNGKLFFKNRVGNIAAGSEVGTLQNKGYKVTSIKKKQTLIHRLIWSYHFGEIPENKQIDHINGERTDNRIENLRLVSPFENSQNQKVHRTGRKPYEACGHFVSRDNIYKITTYSENKKTLHLCHVKTKEEAKEICRFINSGEAVYFLAASINKRINYERL